jgi:hypothetical protein
VLQLLQLSRANPQPDGHIARRRAGIERRLHQRRHSGHGGSDAECGEAGLNRSSELRELPAGALELGAEGGGIRRDLD